MSTPEAETGTPELMPWHRLFGLALTDLLTGTSFVVDIEKDLSVQKQLLDVLIVRKVPGTLDRRLPDGFEDLAEFNLVSFRSYQDTLDGDTLDELLAHYVACRKLVSPSARREDWLPAEAFRLLAVSARFPEGLARQVKLTEVKAGVHECNWGSRTIRVIVLKDLAREPHNAIMHLFTAQEDLLRYGATHFERHSARTSSLLEWLIRRHRKEKVPMSYTWDDFEREVKATLLKELTSKELRECLPPETIREALSPEQRLAGLAPEQRLAGLAPEQRLAGLAPEQRLAGLPLEVIKEFLERMQKEGSSPPPQTP